MAQYSDSKSFALLTKEMRKVNLSKDELTELHAQYFKTKSEVLKNKLITYHLRYVVTIVNAFKTYNSVSFEDKVAYGSIGLVKALMSFDPTKGVTFLSFAKPAIIRQIITELKFDDTIRMKGSHRKAIEDGDLPKYTFTSTGEEIPHLDGATIESILSDDTFDSLFNFEALNHDEKVNIFWDYLKEIMILPGYYDIARASYSATTVGGKAIKVTEEEMGEMFNCTKQNISQKKRIMFNKLREDPKFKEFWEKNFFGNDDFNL